MEPERSDADTRVLNVFDIHALLDRIKNEGSWRREGRHVIVLHSDPSFRIVLFVLAKNTKIPPHKVDCPISVQAVEGVIRFDSEHGSAVLTAGQMTTLPTAIYHHLEALEESAFLLTRPGDSRSVEK